MNSAYRRQIRHGAFAAVLLGLAFAVTGAAQAQTYTDLHDFNAGTGDPTFFNSGRLAQGRDGNFYAQSGNGGTSSLGTIFKVTPSGTVAIIHSLVSTDGYSSNTGGGTTLGANGDFYANGFSGGSSGYGTVFKVTPTGTLTVLHNFTDTGDGYNPANAQVTDTNGNLYGTTDSNPVTIYQITPAGTFSTITTLTTAEGIEGGQLSIGSDGNVYGGMNLGGANGYGTAFKTTPAGVVTVLHNFDPTDGDYAAGGMVQAANGKFYGAAMLGGVSNAGVIYSLTSSGTYAMLHSVNGTTDGYEPYGQVLLASDGNFYGVTNGGGSVGCGTIFKVTPAGAYSVVYNFDSTHGCSPEEQVIQGTNGLLYGLVNGGGAYGNGAFYSLSVPGLRKFAGLVTTTAAQGANIGILGQGFNNTSVVSFDGVNATAITLSGGTFILATVPAGALTGTVTVTTGANVLTSTQSFKVKPTITSFTPPSGPVGTPVMITGTGLTQTTKVTFGGVAATTFTVNSDTQVTADVPASAVTGKITITTSGGTATSSGTFTVN
jgi:uncharacterized repeat protein (TIGR03803 family)